MELTVMYQCYYTCRLIKMCNEFLWARLRYYYFTSLRRTLVLLFIIQRYAILYCVQYNLKMLY